MKDCIEAICSRCTYHWECGPFNECVPKKILLNEMSYREAIPVTIKTVVLADGTKYKDCLCSKCGKHFSLENIFDEVKFCPNCGQKQDWSVSCDK